MQYKWIGVLLVVAGCGGFGFVMSAQQLRQEQLFRQLNRAVRLIEWELKYRLTELPELARMAGKECTGLLRRTFLDFARELDWQSEPDSGGCMHEAIKKNKDLSPKTKALLRQLGSTLGRFDLEGQLQGLEAVRQACTVAIGELNADKKQRLRSYRTLGLCAGAALAILLV